MARIPRFIYFLCIIFLIPFPRLKISVKSYSKKLVFIMLNRTESVTKGLTCKFVDAILRAYLAHVQARLASTHMGFQAA